MYSSSATHLAWPAKIGVSLGSRTKEEIVALSAVLAASESIHVPQDLACDSVLVTANGGRRSDLRKRSIGGLLLAGAVEHLMAGLQLGGAPPPEQRAIVAATRSGALPEIIAFSDEIRRVGEGLVNPGLFPFTVHNTAAGIAAIINNCTGPNITVCQGTASPLLGVLVGANLLRAARAQLVFAGGFETSIPAAEPGAEPESKSLCAVMALTTLAYARAYGLHPRARIVAVGRTLPQSTSALQPPDCSLHPPSPPACRAIDSIEDGICALVRLMTCNYGYWLCAGDSEPGRGFALSAGPFED